MNRRRVRLSIAAVVVMLWSLVLGPGWWGGDVARASISQGIGNIEPKQVSPGSTTPFQLSLLNNDPDNAIVWVRFDLPGGYFSNISQATANGWTAAVDADGVTFSGGAVDPGATVVFQVTAQAFEGTSPPSNWYTHVSDQSDGSGAILADGDLSVEITNGPPPSISGVLLTQITTTAVTINWTTDLPSDSRIDYGDDSTYGKTKSDGAAVTNHALRLTGLKTNTGYHFQISSTNGAGTTITGDNTFFTADAEAISESGGIPGAGSGTVGGGPVTTPTGKPTETTPPAITWTSTVRGAYATAPVFTGTASDNEAVAKVEYSTDGGKNWSGVNSATAAAVTSGSGKKKVTTTDARNVTFSFTPVITEDGDYMVMARATDPSGNQARTTAQTLVIDRLPPRFGGEMVAFGSQVARPDASGRWQAVVGLDQTISLGAVGGPTQVTVQAMKTGSKLVTHSFVLRRNASSGLWQGVMSFRSPGTYDLAVAAVDGAGNRTSQSLAAVGVLAPARVQGADGKAVASGKVTIYYKQSKNGAWTVWDGAGFGQQNPQPIQKDGSFQLLAPAGTYYLKIESKGFQTLVTRQFALDRPTPLVPTLKLMTAPKLGGVVLPWLSFNQTDMALTNATSKTTQPAAVGRAFSSFALPTTNGGTMSAIEMLGKPTVVTVMSTWAPSTSEQLPALAKLQTNGDVNVVPVVMGERMGRIQAFLARSGYDGVNALVDADATLSQVLGVPSVPTHYVLDRKGKVKAVLTGVIKADELLKQLGS